MQLLFFRILRAEHDTDGADHRNRTLPRAASRSRSTSISFLAFSFFYIIDTEHGTATWVQKMKSEWNETWKQRGAKFDCDDLRRQYRVQRAKCERTRCDVYVFGGGVVDGAIDSFERVVWASVGRGIWPVLVVERKRNRANQGNWMCGSVSSTQFVINELRKDRIFQKILVYEAVCG